MKEENNPSDQERNSDASYPQTKQPGIGPGFPSAKQQQNPQHGDNETDRKRKPSIIVRIWHALWRKRLFLHRHEASYPNWAEKTSMIITLGVLVAAGVQAWIYWQQASLMEKAIVQNGNVIDLGIGQLAVANRNTDLAKNSLQVAKDQFSRDQRPYISVTDFQASDHLTRKPIDEFKIGQPLIVTVKFKNIGKTVAVDAIVHRHIIFGKYLKKFRIEPPDKEKGGDTVDAGADQVTTAISLTDTYSNESSAYNIANEVNWDGSGPIVLFGRITYKDLNGTLYCAPFLVEKITGNWVYLNSVPGSKMRSPRDLCPKGKQ